MLDVPVALAFEPRSSSAGAEARAAAVAASFLATGPLSVSVSVLDVPVVLAFEPRSSSAGAEARAAAVAASFLALRPGPGGRGRVEHDHLSRLLDHRRLVVDQCPGTGGHRRANRERCYRRCQAAG